MFNRNTLKLISFHDSKKRFQLLRMMVEGDLTYKTFLQMRDIKEIFRSNGLVNDFVDTVEEYTRFSERLHGTKGSASFEKFCRLSIAERYDTDTADQYHAAILKEAGRDSSILKQFDKVREEDASVLYAVYHLVDMFLYYAYKVDDVSLSDLLNILSSLEKNPLIELKINHPVLLQKINEFQSLYTMLINSYISTDKKDFIAHIAYVTLHRELNCRAPYYGVIRCLEKMKAEFSKDDAKDHVFMFFGTRTPESVSKIKAILAKLPENLNVLNLEIDEKMAEFKQAFDEVDVIVQSEQKGKIFRDKTVDKFWLDRLREIESAQKEFAAITEQKPKAKTLSVKQ